MQLFTFYMLDTPATMPDFVIEFFENTVDAVAYGSRLLAERPGYTDVEVRLDDVEVARLKREAAQASLRL
jgi:hypothetical protein